MEKATALMNNAFDFEKERLRVASDRVVLAVKKLSRITVPGFRIPDYLLNIIRVITALFFAQRVANGDATIADMVASGLVFLMLDTYFQRLLDSYQMYVDEYVTLERLWSFLDSTPDFVRLKNGDEFVQKHGEIRFENVSFAYP